MTEKNFYEVLGVPKDASAETIKKAYLGLALKWHPDKNQDKEEMAAEKFKEIKRAYEILSDTNLKRSYDRSFTSRFETQSGSTSNFRANAGFAGQGFPTNNGFNFDEFYRQFEQRRQEHQEWREQFNREKAERMRQNTQYAQQQEAKNQHFKKFNCLEQTNQRLFIMNLIRDKFGLQVRNDFQFVVNATIFELPTNTNPEGRTIIHSINKVRPSFDKLENKLTHGYILKLVSKFKSGQLEKSDSEYIQEKLEDMPEHDKEQLELKKRVLALLRNNFTNRNSELFNSFGQMRDVVDDFRSIIEKFQGISLEGKVLMENASDSEKNLLLSLRDWLGLAGRRDLLNKYRSQDLNVNYIGELERKLINSQASENSGGGARSGESQNRFSSAASGARFGAKSQPSSGVPSFSTFFTESAKSVPLNQEAIQANTLTLIERKFGLKARNTFKSIVEKFDKIEFRKIKLKDGLILTQPEEELIIKLKSVLTEEFTHRLFEGFKTKPLTEPSFNFLKHRLGLRPDFVEPEEGLGSGVPKQQGRESELRNSKVIPGVTKSQTFNNPSSTNKPQALFAEKARIRKGIFNIIRDTAGAQVQKDLEAILSMTTITRSKDTWIIQTNKLTPGEKASLKKLDNIFGFGNISLLLVNVKNDTLEPIDLGAFQKKREEYVAAQSGLKRELLGFVGRKLGMEVQIDLESMAKKMTVRRNERGKLVINGACFSVWETQSLSVLDQAFKALDDRDHISYADMILIALYENNLTPDKVRNLGEIILDLPSPDTHFSFFRAQSKQYFPDGWHLKFNYSA